MKRILFIIAIIIICFIFIGCRKGNVDYIYDEELSKYNIKSIILMNVSVNNDRYLYAIAEDVENKEVLLKYEIEDFSNKFKIIEIINYDIIFSYKELLIEIENIQNESLKNAFNTIIKKASKIEITEEIEIKEVLKVGNSKKFNAIVFYYEFDGALNKFVFAYDLGDYYVANETTKEIYYPIYSQYNNFS